MEKIYQVANNLHTLHIKPIEIIKKSDSFYWTSKKDRNALNSNYHKSFDDIESARKYMKSIIEQNIMLAKSTIKYYEEKLVEFENIHGDVF